MKIRIEIEDNLTEEEIIIRSGSLNAKVQMIQKAIAVAGAWGGCLRKYRNQFLIPSQKGLQELWMLGPRQSLFNGDRRDCGWKPDGV